MKYKNHAELIAAKLKKSSSSYAIKADNGTGAVSDVDFAKRTVKVVANTMLFYDSDGDILLPGASLNSIAQRGPDSNAPGKIKNVYAHDLKQNIGVPTLLDERSIDGNKVMYAESRLMDTTKGNDTLIEYQEGGIDNHSIGFQYTPGGLELIMDGDPDWSKYLSMVSNPNDMAADGYAFLVSEIKYYEFSPVAFGANSLTPYLGVKSGNKEGLMLKVAERIDRLGKFLRNGKQSDETMEGYELEILQLKQIIVELFATEPSAKDILLDRHKQKDIPPAESKFDLNTAIQTTKIF